MKLLLVACSAGKRLEQGPAIELYDGIQFRYLRRAHPAFHCTVKTNILSVKYGLISADTVIENYNQCAGGWFSRTVDREHQVPIEDLTLFSAKFKEVFIFAGSAYRAYIDQWIEQDVLKSESFIWSVDRNTKDRALNGILSQTARLKSWMNNNGAGL